MRTEGSIADLWASVTASDEVFRAEHVAGHPAPVRRYLHHAIAPGTRLASAVRLDMHGEIKLGRWFPFTATQVLDWNRGMIWQATVRAFGLPIRGYDRIIHGAGAQNWRLFGWIPVMSAAGPDVSRSTAGRMAAEVVWCPSVLCRPNVAWSVTDAGHPQATLTVQGEPSTITFRTTAEGRLRGTTMMRWGDPGDGAFRAVPFGAMVDAERTVDGMTIPSRLRVGWHPQGDGFAADGVFFRATLDEVAFR
jgi:hypothetical protein